MTTYNNMDKSHEHKVKLKKIDSNENIQYDYIHTECKNMKNSAMLLEVRIPLKTACVWGGDCKWEETVLGAGDVSWFGC